MTANEMSAEVELKLDRSDSFGSPGYEDFEISSILTEAQHLYVKKFFDELNNRKQRGFEETEIRNQGLEGLLKSGFSLPVSSSQTNVLTNGKFFDLPLDHMYTVYEECILDKARCGSTTEFIVADVVPIAHNEIRRLLTNKYKKPFCKSYGNARVWRTSYSRETSAINPLIAATAKRNELTTDGTFNITTYNIRYVKNPNAIVVDLDTPSNQKNCELDLSTHVVIVDIAVDLMLQRIKEQKMQITEPFREVE